MASERDEFNAIVSDAERFLRQQKEMYGDLFLSPPDVQTKTDNSTESTMKTKNVPPSAENQDLFGAAPKSDGAIPAAAPLPDLPWTKSTTLADLNTAICNCMNCSLGATRTKFVFGVGNPNADLVLVGEAPGADEDLQGEPFVGRAGQLLNKILEAINFKREDVYICNILKCRPPNNRDPLPEEVAQCEPYLWKQLELLNPKIILCLGRIAAQVLLKTSESLTSLRGRVHDYRGIRLMVTYHPAALLRNPNWKRPAWEDVQKVRRMYDELVAGKP